MPLMKASASASVLNRSRFIRPPKKLGGWLSRPEKLLDVQCVLEVLPSLECACRGFRGIVRIRHCQNNENGSSRIDDNEPREPNDIHSVHCGSVAPIRIWVSLVQPFAIAVRCQGFTSLHVRIPVEVTRSIIHGDVMINL